MKKLFVCIYSLLMLFAFSFPTLAATQDYDPYVETLSGTGSWGWV